MLAIPVNLQARFEALLQRKQVPNSLNGYRKKWLRYYLAMAFSGQTIDQGGTYG
jgi:hypothetical protein